MNEDTLLGKFGNENHFTVPDGYFDSVESRIMSKLTPLGTEIGADNALGKYRISRWRKVVSWAACTIVLLTSGAIFYYYNQSKGIGYSHAANQQSIANHYNEDMLIDKVSDCAMIDNGDLYTFATDEKN